MTHPGCQFARGVRLNPCGGLRLAGAIGRLMSTAGLVVSSRTVRATLAAARLDRRWLSCSSTSPPFTPADQTRRSSAPRSQVQPMLPSAPVADHCLRNLHWRIVTDPGRLVGGKPSPAG